MSWSSMTSSTCWSPAADRRRTARGSSGARAPPAPRQECRVLHDVSHLLEPRRGPAPDVSVILGAQNIDRNLESYNLAKIGIAPSLIIEVVSPTDSRIRRVDEEEKVGLYARVGVAEYILEDMPRPATGWRATPGGP